MEEICKLRESVKGHLDEVRIQYDRGRSSCYVANAPSRQKMTKCFAKFSVSPMYNNTVKSTKMQGGVSETD